MRRRQHAKGGLHLSRLEHLLAQFLPLQHQTISVWAAGILRWRRSPTTHTHRCCITLGTILQVDHAEFPLPLVQRTEGVEKLLLTMKSKVTELLGLRDVAFMKRLIDKELGIAPPPVKLTTGSSPVRGAPNATVTIWVFSDFQCPVCSRAMPAVDQIMNEFGGSVRLVFKNFPLDFHKDAPQAHEAAAAAGEQRKFWEMHDELFRQQSNLKPPDLIRAAQRLGLDANLLSEALQSRRFQAAITADVEEGRLAGVEGTPTFFVNGRMLVGLQTVEQLRRVVAEEIQKTKTTASLK